ncbi:ATP-binding protein [Lentzea sp. CA-135723]|uniref:sensor histidine kinase n=1 Tax=Lentzea sp. CA-135723 TaxID=3239950 RepID=UPI003D939979
MTLRVRLVVVLVALAAAGLFGTWLIGSTVMERYLLGQVDARLDRVVSAPRAFPLRENVIVRDASGVISGTPFAGLPEFGALVAGEHVTAGTHRVVMRDLDGTELIAFADQSEVDRAVDDLRLAFLLISLGALILVGMAGYALVRASTRALEEVEQVAGEIAAGDLSRRVPVRRPGSEVGRLAAALNTMLGQIESAFAARVSSEKRMREFVADASHELRTPLTSIRGYAELYRQGAASSAAEVLRRIEDHATRMGVLVDDLLQLARLDSDQPLTLSEVDLVVVVTDTVTNAVTDAVAETRPNAVADAVAEARPNETIRLVSPTPPGTSQLTQPKPHDPSRATPPKPSEASRATPPEPSGPSRTTPPEPSETGWPAPPELADPSCITPPEPSGPSRATPPKPSDSSRPAPPKPADPSRATPPEASGPSRATPPEASDASRLTSPEASDPSPRTPPKSNETIRLVSPPSSAPAHLTPPPPNETIRFVSLALPAAPVRVEADEARVRQILTNLLHNALIHTPPGTPIDVRLTSTSLEVADQGPGMTTDQAARAFERFYRADPARGPGGTGLGLAIVDALVAAHGWRIDLVTSPGDGAVFRVLFGP